ncbi:MULTISPECIES: 16S rRNA (guanine(966)-N(2))-methyltransferase RsmD [Gordonia]|uniref:16S rRNA (Guanine(966)-N(2))-methyltransferase RsmD n=1 Tax=Gordonia amicalis TaxID=89053 RepID=A0AAE4U935_9ACTN|nr:MULTISPECIES: 16S rRNA (guanine(966)-N(2))-methyltransferase RsmD [Gordonia]ATD70564.1 16S rRNA (guanine(966)-N(2))-methyltransferase RsmD [Gordonia sp. 1D]KAF0970617.1 Ribosomal RNA small subunit methyltransferase D [Gordonia sp. YY1]MCR8895660.1 16S rRNA (guanine(966)-N(2))-methyltransferase RsmD [Gordonia sp. GONU]MCZ0913562.1 16S rRNA (guanine(966)-N(2))-methyltransferase RsmD [Gordonia amicalis]MCZ4577558.1 16S rRNA (guanine(966)-N(2))-methyltransferase RsmD [Gordonia amicalis]
MTRIIAGELRGRRLRVPGEGTRPTSDRVRESVFNILDARFDLDGLWVLDLYAGSGALGIEAVSRGAAGATFVDSARKAAAVIGANVQVCGIASSTTVLTRPVSAYLSSPPERKYDLVFSDPPYAVDASALSEDLTRLAATRLAEDALVVVERSARSTGRIWPAGFEVLVDKNYGDTRVEVGEFTGA